MSSNCRNLLLAAASLIATSALSLIIELPPDYNPTAPWEQLAALGLKNLTETDCLRPCVTGESPRVCVYSLVLEHYATMGTACGKCSEGILEDCFRPQCIPSDGHKRGVMSINRKIPGPQIHVCKNDLIVAKVTNRMTGTGSTIHWHGVHQKHSPWMDGVPRITQCPIGAGETFTYIFLVEEAGTMFYHSHTGEHKMNGHYGALIIREPRSDEAWSADIYSLDLPEHTILLSDWMHDYAEMVLPGLSTKKSGIRPTTILCNGLGRYLDITENENPRDVPVPLATFHVQRNQRYRFRIINAATMYCPLQIQIEDHKMTLIATDGYSIEPVTIDTLVTYEGERFDIVIDTHNVTLEKNAFWIHIRGLGICEFDFKLDQYAVLSYDAISKTDLGIIPEGVPPTVSKPLPTVTIVNHPNITCGVSPNRLCITDLMAIGKEIDDDISRAKPDVQLFIPLGSHEFYKTDDFHKERNYQRFLNPSEHFIESAVMNNISFLFLTTPTLFVRDRDPGFCNPQKLPTTCQSSADNSTPYCECTYFEIIKENDIVELTFIDSFEQFQGINHAMHLHGYSFYVTYIGQNLTKPTGYTVDEVRKILHEKRMLDLEYQALNKTLCAPPIKDTVSVPSRGFTTVRWKANNPGDWLLHCHFDWHSISGMVMGIRVEGEIPQRPPNFPTCNGFDPL